GEADTYRRQHRDYFLALVQDAAKSNHGPEQSRWLDRLETEHDNLRQALTFCLEEGKGGETGLLLGAGLVLFWVTRGHLSEGRERLIALLARPDAQERTKARAAALNGAGAVSRMQGNY